MSRNTLPNLSSRVSCGKAVSASFLLFALALPLGIVGCGGGNNSVNGSNGTLLSVAGNYASSAATPLSTGRAGALALTVAANNAATGTFTVTDTGIRSGRAYDFSVGIFNVAGTVDPYTGAYTLTGNFPGSTPFSIGGTLPTSGQNGNYTITVNGETFTGSVGALTGNTNPGSGTGAGSGLSATGDNNLVFSAPTGSPAASVLPFVNLTLTDVKGLDGKPITSIPVAYTGFTGVGVADGANFTKVENYRELRFTVAVTDKPRLISGALLGADQSRSLSVKLLQTKHSTTDTRRFVPLSAGDTFSFVKAESSSLVELSQTGYLVNGTLEKSFGGSYSNKTGGTAT
ncbi:MAG: hypothetical protein H7308_14090, partial [Chthonomonadaceae bacterium]|nr:hypothetical protein [Chthonomonadaceae bacterium]